MSEMFEGSYARIVRYWSAMIDWSNTRIVKTAFNFSNLFVLTDEGKVKL